MDKKYEAIFCVVNAGFSDNVMAAARKAGAGGGTILKGRGAAPREAEEIFKITIQPEKEIVMILVGADIKDRVLRAIYDEAGLGSAGQGIAFSLPIERAVGLSDYAKKETE
ncbi:MAG: P-II family nitrogen regulator [Lachnospiraceae bacterium]|nr:P-II family nitrogen regulator [Lachnospiraceae bacterium]